MKKTKLKKLLIIYIVIIGISIILESINYNVNATNEDNSITYTKAYFCSGITKGYGNGDCILLENKDTNGNTLYGLIDAGRKINTQDNTSTTVKDFLNNHGVTRLEFVIITHSHGDHNGDAQTVLNNFEVSTLYMKDCDASYSDGTQSIYEALIKIAVNKGINVIGVGYNSLSNRDFCPSASESFFNFMQDLTEKQKSKFSAFNEKNTEFTFGSAKMKFYNWEIFDTDGNVWTAGVSQTTRETVPNENNNALVLKVTQGNKTALFTGDMNNLDENIENGRIGDEDRLKNEIGDIDFLKLGHHGYEYSNTEDYLNTIKPEYAVITNNIGGGYIPTLNWIKDNNVKYLYTTADEEEIVTTITENDIYMNFETTNSLKYINGKIYYIPDYDKTKYIDWQDIAYQVNYTGTNIVEVSSWEELKATIESNKNGTINEINKTYDITKLNIKLKKSNNWGANSNIEIESYQNITLTADENITITRDTSLVSSNLLTISGTLNLGTPNMSGIIILDGNKENVTATSCLIDVELGTLNIYDNVVLQNNKNVQNGLYKAETIKDYGVKGSAIYSYNSIINMYGGEIINNENDTLSTITLNNSNTSNSFDSSSVGTGIYLCNNSTINMYGGKINNNIGENHSTYNISGTTYKSRGSFSARVDGIGIYSANSTLNLEGGEISNNIARNYTISNLSNGTNIYSLNNVNYGIGIYSASGIVDTRNITLTGNESIVSPTITIDKTSSIDTTLSIATRGGNIYLNKCSVNISDSNISGSISNKDNKTINNSGSIKNTSFTDCGGNLDAINCETVNINNSIFSDATSDSGGGIYLNNSNATINNSTINNNVSTGQGGGIYVINSDVQIDSTIISNNIGTYGGGLYVAGTSSNTNLKDVKVFENETTAGSGGGVYAYGTISIEGSKTEIKSNTAYTYGGGLMLKTEATISDGTISNNKAMQNAGGGVRTDGKLIVTGGTITNNTAKTTGGGIDWTPGILILKFATVENNTAIEEGNDIYPVRTDESDDWTKDESLNITPIEVQLEKKFTRSTDIRNVSMQGMTTTNKYIVFAQMSAEDSNTYINIIDKNTYEILNTVDSYCFGHANNLTYNSKEDRCYIAYTSNSKKYITSFKINADYELDEIKTTEVNRYYFAFTYDVDDDYLIGINGNTVYIMDTDLNEIRNFSVQTYLTKQDITYYNGYIYYACWEAGAITKYQTQKYNNREKYSNVIYMYDMEGNLEKTLYISNEVVAGEIEGLSIENSNLLLGYNTDKWGSISFYSSSYLSEVFAMELTSLPNKKEYIQNYETLDLTGGEITVTYNNMSTEKIGLTNENVKVTGFDNTKIGKNTLTVEYGGKTATFDVKIISKQIKEIEVTTNPSKSNYIQNYEKLDLTGGILTVKYDDESTDTVSLTNENVKVTGFDNTKIGKNTLTVEYGGKTATFDVKIISKQIKEIEVTTNPSKSNYIQNYEKLDLTGGILTVKYDDESTDTVSLTNENVKVTGFDNTKIGKNTLTVEYRGKTATFDVEIIEKNGVNLGENNEKKEDSEKDLASIMLPHAGIKSWTFILIIMLSILAITSYKKYKNLK